ncbi:hypothetical protein FA15DRAFT_45748 [Coprinopsis marcescibilis]|uniref:F-box domain-containing protein n=1 Tax=Coprinopsis marcescibilis TaxID=230819 RepID=A0A5C3KP33_COPMA|nr:hypothetical protein FA15DRAFT_45748 [Coprinopsis marcescibilis]
MTSHDSQYADYTVAKGLEMTRQELPNELLIQILKCLLPPIKPTPTSDTIIDYYQQLTLFAALRAVSGQWDSVISFLLYDHVLLPSTSIDQVKPTIGLMAQCRNPELIKILTISGLSGNPTKVSIEQSKEGLALLNTHLQRLKNAQIRRLELIGETPAFQTRQWKSRTLPNLHNSLETLVLTHFGYKQTSLALVEVGPSLHHLEMVGWQYVHRHSRPTLHLPSNMPNLTKLVLKDCFPFRNDFAKLFSRIGEPIFDPVRKRTVLKSNLREFLLQGNSILRPTDVLELVRLNSIGKSLTVLHLSFSHSTSGKPEAGTLIAKTCRSLIDFQYTGPIQQSFFSALAPSISKLGVAIWSPSNGFTSALYLSTLNLGYFTQERLKDVLLAPCVLDELNIVVHGLKYEPRFVPQFGVADEKAIRAKGTRIDVEFLNV